MQKDVFSVLDSTAGSRKSRELAVGRITEIDRCRATICTLAHEDAAFASVVKATYEGTIRNGSSRSAAQESAGARIAALSGGVNTHCADATVDDDLACSATHNAATSAIGKDT